MGKAYLANYNEKLACLAHKAYDELFALLRLKNPTRDMGRKF